MSTNEDKKEKSFINKIKLKYKIEQNEDEFINLFGIDFAKVNKNKCTMVIEGKEYKLRHKFNKRTLRNSI